MYAWILSQRDKGILKSFQKLFFYVSVIQSFQVFLPELIIHLFLPFCAFEQSHSCQIWPKTIAYNWVPGPVLENVFGSN
jgi:hypothetical protein